MIKFLFDALISRNCNFVNCVFHLYYFTFIGYFTLILLILLENIIPGKKEIFQVTMSLYILLKIVSLCQMHLSQIFDTQRHRFVFFCGCFLFCFFCFTFFGNFYIIFLYVVCSGKVKCLAFAWFWSFWPFKKKISPEI